MKKERILLVVLAAALGLTSCSGPDPISEETVRPFQAPALAEVEERRSFTLACYPGAGFHPISGGNRLNLTLAPLIYQGLFKVSQDFRAEKDLCESYTVSGDGLMWTFRLTEAIFSDGAPLTAREVVNSLNIARRSQRYSGRFADVERIAAEGETVVVTLFEPNGGLPLLLDIPIIKEGEDPQRPVGTGPYVITEGEGELTLTARQGAQVPLSTIALRTVEAGDDLVYAFDSQEISLVDADLIGTNALGYSGRLETTDYPTTTLLYIGCNLSSGACREQRTRQALALSVDRDGIAERVLAGHAAATSLPVHPQAPGFDAGLDKSWKQDPERAGVLLGEAGWIPGEDGVLKRGREELSLRLIVNQDNTFKTAVAETVADALKETGCRIVLDKLSWEEFTAALEKREFDLYLGETALTADFDLRSLLGGKGGLNYSGFADPESWELMAQYRGSRGEERETTLVNLCGRVAEMAPIIPLCFKNGSLLTQWGQVSGAEPTQRDVFAGFENWKLQYS